MNLGTQINRLRLSLLLIIAAFAGGSQFASADNLLEFYLQNQRPNGNCTEYYAELWVTVADGESWEVSASNLSLSFNTTALDGMALSPAMEANATLTGAGYSITQVDNGSFLSIGILKFPPYTSLTAGSYHVATFRWDVLDASEFDNLVFITAGPATTISDNGVPLNYNCNNNTCFGVTNPTPSQVVGGGNILAHPTDETVCAGDDADFNVTARGCGITYQWQFSNGGAYSNIAGATSSTLTVSNVTTGDAGNYRVEVNADYGPTVTSNVASLTVNSAPAVTSQPADITVCENQDADFTIANTGTAPVTIQWQQFDVLLLTWDDLVGENGTTLTVSNVQTSDDGNQYRATLTNLCGSATSDIATLSVNTIPVVNVDPSNQTTCVGQGATFTANANGTPAPTVQWQISTGGAYSDIVGETNVSLNLSNVVLADNGNMYRAVFTNACGVVTTASAQLTVNDVPTITVDPSNQTVCETGNTSFSVTATSPIAVTYQWQLSTGGAYSDIAGETSATLSLTNVASAMNGNMYRAVVTNVCGSSTSASAMLTVDTNPVVTADPTDETVCEGDNASFAASATSSPAPTVQWQMDDGNGWADIVGETNTTLNLVAVNSGMNGYQYRAVFTNVCATTASAAATLNVNTVPVVVTDPSNQSGCAGDNFVFSAAASGTPTPAVQWQVSTGGAYSDLAGETSATLTLNAVPASWNGNMYRAVFTNVCGTVTSAVATLTIDDPPTVTANPTDATECVGDDAVFTSNGTGVPAPTIQWEVNDGNGWAALAGETSTTLTLTNLNASQDGNTYRAVYTNACGAATTASAQLTVITPPTVTADPVDVEACEGDNVDFTASATGSNPTVQWQVNTGGGWTNVTGANTTVLSLTNVPASYDGNLYRAVFTNLCGTTATAVATLGIDVPPTVTLQPADETVCENDNASFTAAASGVPAPTVQWQQSTDGIVWNNIPAATSGTYTLTGVLAAWDGYQFRAVFTNSCGTDVESNAATLNVNVPPTITAQPTDETVCEGDDASFMITATSNIAINYQWEVNDGNGWVTIPGATNNSYTAVAVTAAMDGYMYRCVASNVCGSETSDAATLTVNTSPVVTLNPSSQNICEGDQVDFTAAATASPAPTVQWQVNDGNGWTDIAGEVNLTLTIAAVTVAMDQNEYRAVFTNLCGTASTAAATLTVYTAPTVASNPADVTICEGENASFSATATGVPAPTTQWQMNDGNGWSDIAGETSSSLNLTNLPASADGYMYRAHFTNVCGEAFSSAATLTVNTPAVIAADPADVDLCEGLDAVFTATINGQPNPSVQWQVNTGGGWITMAGATTNPLTITGVSQSAHDGNFYRVIATNDCGTDTSLAASLTVRTVPVVTTHPEDQTVCDGELVTFTSAAGGTLPPTIQWQVGDGVNWTDIPGATSATYQFNAVVAQNGARFRAEYTNLCGTVYTNEGILTVNAPVVVTLEPASVEICEGDDNTFLVEYTGTPSPTIQWQLNDGNGWSNLVGETSAELEVMNVAASMNGYEYRAVLTNFCGTTTSATAVLTVNTSPVVVSDPASTTVCEGDNASFSASASGMPTPSVQWQMNSGSGWNNIAGETNAVLTLTAVNAGMSGYTYRAVFTNVCGEATTAPATLNVNTAPVVTVDPMSQNVCDGNSITFTAQASATPTPSVQWEVDNGNGWTAIPGATSTTYTFVPTINDDANMYRAVFSNVCGDATSDVAVLTFYTLAEITQDPVGTSVCEGETVTFNVAATGRDITYQWRKDGIVIPGENGNSLTISAADFGDQGNYDVVVSNLCNTVVSNPASLTVNVAPIITLQPLDLTVCAGEFAFFEVQAEGSDLTYQWQVDNGNGFEDIAGETQNMLTMVAAQVENDGTYRCVINGTCPPTLYSNEVDLDVNVAPAIVEQPTGQTVCEGEEISLEVIDNGADGMTYQWYHNGMMIPGAVASTYTVAAAQTSDAGTYSVQLTSLCDPSVMSVEVTVNVNTLPRIVGQPSSAVVCYGDVVSMSVDATGTGLMYQWEYSENGVDWMPIAGSNGSTISVNGAMYDDAGYYRVVVSGTCDNAGVMSSVAQLVVNEPVMITRSPESQTVCLNGNVVFTASATGTPVGTSLDYRWYHNGNFIATGEQLIISGLQYDQAGEYVCVVTGACGPVSTDIALLYVQEPTTAKLREPNDFLVPPGSDVVFEVRTNAGDEAEFQWYRGNTPLSDNGHFEGTQTSELRIFNAQKDDESQEYHCVVTGPCGTQDSDNGSLNIDDPTVTITKQPVDFAVCEGTEVCFEIAAETNSSDEIVYQWFTADGTAIDGATSATYCVTVTADDNGLEVFCNVSLSTDPGITENSGNARVVVSQAPVIVAQPEDQRVCEGDPASMSVSVSNEAETYQWFYNDMPLPGATTNTIAIETTATIMAGTYYVVITNTCGTTQSDAAELSFNQETEIVTQPVQVGTTNINSNLVLEVEAIGEGPCSYQWYKDGVMIDGADEATYTVFVEDGEAHMGDYHVVVTCLCGEVVSETVTPVIDLTTDVNDIATGELFGLEQNFPNPFAGSTAIAFTMYKSTDVRLAITDMYGNEVAVLVDDFTEAGRHVVEFNSQSTLSSGTYMYTLTAEGRTISKRMVLVK